MLNNSYLQGQGHEITIKVIMNAQVWILNSVLKVEMVKDIDKAGEPIEKGGNKRSQKKSELDFLNIQKSSNKVVFTTKEQSAIELTNEFLSTESEKLVLLHFKTKIWSWISYVNCKNIDTIPEKWRKDIDCNRDINL